jgi:transaldolase
LDSIFTKIPGTAAGLPSIEERIYAGVAVNVTPLLSAAQYQAAAEACLREVYRRIRVVGEFLPADVDQVIAAFAQADFDTAVLAAELQRHGAEAFAAAWQDRSARIGASHEQLARTA